MCIHTSVEQTYGAAIGVCVYGMIAIGVREESDDATRLQIIYSTRLHL